MGRKRSFITARALGVPAVCALIALTGLAWAGALTAPSRAGTIPLASAQPVPVVASGTPLVSSRGWSDNAYAARVWELVNDQRRANGLNEVTNHERLSAAATAYARTLADNGWFSHTGPDGSTLVSRVEAAGFPFDVRIGEILAWGAQHWTPEAMVQAWMNSPEHRADILDRRFTRAGLGCYFIPANGVTVYCAMEFAE